MACKDLFYMSLKNIIIIIFGECASKLKHLEPKEILEISEYYYKFSII